MNIKTANVIHIASQKFRQKIGNSRTVANIAESIVTTNIKAENTILSSILRSLRQSVSMRESDCSTLARVAGVGKTTALAAVALDGADTHDEGSRKTFILYTSIESLFAKWIKARCKIHLYTPLSLSTRAPLKGCTRRQSSLSQSSGPAT
jgi:hypothetical protein